MSQYAKYSGLGSGGGGGGTVTSVTASAPLASSGGTTPNISLTGIVPIANGGTGQSTANTALNALLPSQATHAGQVLSTDGTNTSWMAVGGTGTVTSVSVVSANGLAGTVANPTTTPAITLSTTITGILQGNGTAISAATTGNLTDVGTDGIVITSGTGAVLGAGTSISQHVADTTHNGYLSSTDWNTFNSKQAAGSYITALTGDVTASGPGSVAATLATVNGNIGTFGSSTSIPTFTVNAKGLITAASGNVVIAPAGTLTGTTLNSTVVTSSLASVGTITSGVWNGTTIAIANGGTGQTTASAAFGALSPLTTKGDVLGYSTLNARVPVGSDGQVLTADSTQALGVKWAASGGGSTARVNALYDEVVGSSAQVTSGAATQTSLTAAIAAVSTDGTILVLKGTYTENPVINKLVFIQGQGHGSVINGTLEFATGSDDSLVQALKITDNITIDAGVNEIQLVTFWQANGKTVIGDTSNCYIQGMRE